MSVGVRRSRRLHFKSIVWRPNCCPNRLSIRCLALFCVLLLAVINEQRFNGQVGILSQGDEVHRLDGIFQIHPEWHPQNRSDRFPSVEERVKLYMSNWYAPPCPGVGRFQYQLLDDDGWPSLNVSRPLDPAHSDIFDSIVKPDQWFLLDRRTMKNCARKQWKHVLRGKQLSSRVLYRRNMRPYCSDVIDLLYITNQLETSTKSAPTPLLAYFGDGSGLGISLPFFAKYRSAATKESLRAVTGECDTNARAPLHTVQHSDKLKPIIWRLESSRHLQPLTRARKEDTPWERKLNRAFWAGDMTGPSSGATDFEQCRSNQRCRFVLDHAHSSLIDCGLTGHRLGSDVINGTNIKRNKVTMSFIQKYKVIISLEGNDVASGLKWSLQSESVVLMPPPTQTSWVMEELLEPWVHYIPMLPDGSNAEKMIKWVFTHEQEARRIAERATLFMYDLLYHPDAMRDERQVKEAIVRRHRAFWSSA